MDHIVIYVTCIAAGVSSLPKEEVAHRCTMKRRQADSASVILWAMVC